MFIVLCMFAIKRRVAICDDGVVTEKIIYTWILRFVFRKHLYRFIWDWHIKRGHHLVVKSTHWLNHSFCLSVFFVLLSFSISVFMYVCVSYSEFILEHRRSSLFFWSHFVPFWALKRFKWGLDGWMVIIGHRSSTSTFGANKNEFEGRSGN